MKSIKRTIAGLAILLLANCVGATQQFLELEDGEGLVRYPYDHEAGDGWYAREMNIRGLRCGRQYCAAIHKTDTLKTRTMSLPLEKPLPPGKYRVFLRWWGPSNLREDCIVKVRIGDAVADYKWEPVSPRKNSRFKWIPGKGMEFELNKPADEVSVEVVSFGGVGHKIWYNSIYPTIYVDSLYITDDMEEGAPNAKTEMLLRDGLDYSKQPERDSYAVDTDGPSRGTTPTPVEKDEAIKILLQPYAKGRNLWPNSSFELGMNDGWSTVMSQSGYVLTEDSLVKGNAVHGDYSLRIDKGNTGFSRMYYLPEDMQVTLSVYLKGPKDASIQLKDIAKYETVLKADGDASGDWTRLTASGELKKGWYALYVPAASDTDVLIDAIQLEAGDSPTEFAPRAPVEGAIRTECMANAIYDGQDNLYAWINNSSKKDTEVSLDYRIIDVRGRKIAAGKTDPIKVGSGSTIKKKLNILPEQRGIFSLQYAVSGRDMPEGETVYVKMPSPPKTVTRHEYGANMTADKGCLAPHARLGFKNALTCKTREFGESSSVHPTPDKWNWQDERAANPPEYGIRLVPCFWPHPYYCANAKHMNRKTVGTYRPYRTGYLDVEPDPVKWKEYIKTVAGHYKDSIKVWCLDDETEMNWAPDHLTIFGDITAKAVKEAAPDSKLACSCSPEFFEESGFYMDTSQFDYFGMSSFDVMYWPALKIRHIRQRYGLPGICYGVGQRGKTSTMYHSQNYYEPFYWKAARMGRRVVNMMLLQDLAVAGHYASVLRNKGTHHNDNKPLLDYDGTPLAWGATFAVMGTLLADAKPIEDFKLGDSGTRCLVFKIGDRLGAVTWATFVRSNDLHWRPTQREIHNLTLTCPDGKVEPLDMYWNPLPGADWKDGKLVMNLNEEPTFILNNGLSEKAFMEMLTSAHADPPALSAKVSISGLKDNSVMFDVDVINRSGRKLEDVTVDFRLPERGKQPMLISGLNLVRNPFARLGPIDNDKSVSKEFQTIHDGNKPLECALVRTYMKTKNGTEGASDSWVWMMPAPSVSRAPTLDGKLSEWEDRDPVWLYYDWATALLSRHYWQIEEGGEYFGYPPYRVDSRAAVWSAWDDKNAYIALRVQDDQFLLDGDPADCVRIILGNGENAKCLTLKPRVDGSVAVGGIDDAKAVCVMTTTKQPNGAASKIEAVPTLCLELAVPWQACGLNPEQGNTVGFDVLMDDTDEEDGKRVTGTLRWAGNADGTGYMLLK